MRGISSDSRVFSRDLIQRVCNYLGSFPYGLGQRGPLLAGVRREAAAEALEPVKAGTVVRVGFRAPHLRFSAKHSARFRHVFRATPCHAFRTFRARGKTVRLIESRNTERCGGVGESPIRRSQ